MFRFLRFTFAFIFVVQMLLAPAFAQAERYPFEVMTPDCACPELEWKGLGMELKPISQSANEYEIRINLEAKWFDRITVVISKNKDGYQGFFYHKYKDPLFSFDEDSVRIYNGRWEPHHYKKFPISHVNLDSVVNLLFSYGMTTLPNQVKLYKPPSINNIRLSYKMEDSTRSIVFGNPDRGPLRDYPQEPVFKRYKDIIDLFNDITRPLYTQVWSDIKKERDRQERDTVFLRKPDADGHAVFIDKGDDDSQHYKFLENLDYTKADLEYLNDLRKLVKLRSKSKIVLPDEEDLPRNWIPLYVIKNDFHVYVPSNKSPLRVSFNDSTMITSEKARSVQLMFKMEKLERRAFQLTTKDEKGKVHTFKIHMVRDRVAVFEGFLGKDTFVLMVNAKYANAYPLVLNYSPKHMEEEYEFKMPNFGRLINPSHY